MHLRTCALRAPWRFAIPALVTAILVFSFDAHAHAAAQGANSSSTPAQDAATSAGGVRLATGGRAGSIRVYEVQWRLVVLGYRPGRVNGRLGPRTRAAVRQFQRDQRLDADRLLDAGTLERLRPATHGLAVSPQGWPSGWSAGPVGRWTGYFTAGGSRRVREIQWRLVVLGYHPGRINGRLGIRTLAAVRTFQRRQRLAPNGLVALRTLERLRPATHGGAVSPGSLPVGWSAGPVGRWTGYFTKAGSRRVRAVQRRLRRLGYAPGAINGRFGERTGRALRRFQRRKGLPTNGIVNLATLYELRGREGTLMTASQSARAAVHAPSRAAPAPPVPERRLGLDLPLGGALGVLALLALAAIVAVARALAARRRLAKGEQHIAAEQMPRSAHATPGSASTGLQHVPDAPPPAPPQPAVAAIGYVSVPWPGTGAMSDRVLAQRDVIQVACRQRRLTAVAIVGDLEPRSGRAFDRPGLQHALDRLGAGEATCLVVTNFDRMTHSATELAALVRWLERRAVRLIVVELGVDTATDAGRAAVRSLVAARARVTVPEPTLGTARARPGSRDRRAREDRRRWPDGG